MPWSRCASSAVAISRDSLRDNGQGGGFESGALGGAGAALGGLAAPGRADGGGARCAERRRGRAEAVHYAPVEKHGRGVQRVLVLVRRTLLAHHNVLREREPRLTVRVDQLCGMRGEAHARGHGRGEIASGVGDAVRKDTDVALPQAAVAADASLVRLGVQIGAAQRRLYVHRSRRQWHTDGHPRVPLHGPSATYRCGYPRRLKALVVFQPGNDYSHHSGAEERFGHLPGKWNPHSREMSTKRAGNGHFRSVSLEHQPAADHLSQNSRLATLQRRLGRHQLLCCVYLRKTQW